MSRLSFPTLLTPARASTGFWMRPGSGEEGKMHRHWFWRGQTYEKTGLDMGFDMDFLIVLFWVHFQFFLCEDVAEILVSAPAKDVADVSDPSGAGPTLFFRW